MAIPQTCPPRTTHHPTQRTSTEQFQSDKAMYNTYIHTFTHIHIHIFICTYVRLAGGHMAECKKKGNKLMAVY